MGELFRRITFGLIFTALIAGAWTAAWAKGQADAADRNYWPALHPEMFHFDSQDK